MTHPRKIIREDVRAKLEAAGTNAEGRVWASREPPVDVETIIVDQGPALLVYTRRDRTASRDAHSGQGFGWEKRECELVVEAVAGGALDVDTKLDALSEQVEEVMDDIQITGMPAAEIRHVETLIESDATLDTPIGGAMIIYEVCYYRQWRKDEEDEAPFFPNQVNSSSFSQHGELVADCVECEECPPGAQP
jgi:hypothetical protein